MKKILIIFLFVNLMIVLYSFPDGFKMVDIFRGIVTCYLKDSSIIEGNFSGIDNDFIYIGNILRYNDENGNEDISVIYIKHPISKVDSIKHVYQYNYHSAPIEEYILSDIDIGALTKHVIERDLNVSSLEYIAYDDFKKSELIIKLSYDINYVGGCEVSTKITNLSNNPIKYITINMTPYNEVDDPVTCRISKTSKKSIKATGFINKNQTRSYEWEPVWYNATIRKIRINSVTITYKDNSVKTITGNDKRLIINYH